MRPYYDAAHGCLWGFVISLGIYAVAAFVVVIIWAVTR